MKRNRPVEQVDIEPGSVKVAAEMAVLGVLARVDVPQRERIVDALASLDGVSTFSVDEEERIGILIETTSLDEAHATLTGEVDKVEGVLATWPVFAHAEADSDPGRTVLQGAGDGKDTP